MTDFDLPTLDRAAFADQVAAYHRSFGKDFWRLLWTAVAELASGKPIRPERLAVRARVPLDRTLAIARDAWEWDARGERLIGAGLTSLATPYRVDIDDRTMWTYCAPDTLQLPVMLGKPVYTHSSCAATSDPIRVHATPTGMESIDPASTVVSFPNPSLRPGLTNVRQLSCEQSSFYRNARRVRQSLPVRGETLGARGG
nr:organomercurial lyase [Kibdelosporangium sp. MJ126-NF4]CEL17390.1 Organomercurial lyase [Kibdelosporangium sp. MJ126-NF4]CTQ91382.1 Organomercurial lyase (EC 4.99.1.2) [Kibdelosporangium sp. MJ126-NF4]